MFGIGLPELLVIFLVCLLLFGASRLPDIGRSLGKGIREFKDALKEGQEEPKKDDKKS
jgi:sec-independent protein translocase protein TatA